ncbi:MAG: sugar kinase [Candidatus Fischerbacteria bacterium RBG_13_37_8]|uniref:Sugar kinase n=1 Tax=Candidatus Fischerbacteria bacterium RBG_13_37_8 TaxID=1817863 RepID=A0A1F5VYR2_9BACT|nr:MAG: sugar kinase [Candidatus Fischerbacteria bacterium RBG_13_37_8]
MSIVVVGTVAYDSIITTSGSIDEALGGSATYFSVASSIFTKTKIVATVGEDFSETYFSLFKGRGIDIAGIDVVPGRTFRWKGKYSKNLNERTTLETQLNVLKKVKVKLPASYTTCSILFLANIDPEIQLEVLSQMKKTKFIAMDTMNFWITSKAKKLKELLHQVDLLCINEEEAELLSGEDNIVKSCKKILMMGPSVVIIKRGSYGAILFHDIHICSMPAYPLENVMDPTGAGDSFAGGFLGYLSTLKRFSINDLRKALAYGNMVASYTVEDFSVNKLVSIHFEDIESRYELFKSITAIC